MARRKKHINIKLMAKEANVSVATISRVINNRTDVSEALRKRVQAVVSKFDFSPTKRVERRINIGIIVPIVNPVIGEYMAQVLNGIARYSGESNIDATIIIDCLSFQSKSLLQIIRERRCDAVVVISPARTLKEIDDLDNAGIPTMLVNVEYKANKIGYINNKSYAGAITATNYLLQLGHRNIGFICGSMANNVNHQERLQGYKDAMENAGEKLNPDWIIPHQPTHQTPEAGYIETQALLDKHPEISAIFATNDEMAFGAIKACWDRGLHIPNDISIIGFDDIPFSSYMHPALSTIRQPLSELGYRAIKYLDLYLKGKITELPTENMETELIIRQSVTIPPQNKIGGGKKNA
jgi:DNA-binding LacI/PurR family transcriptional regulator